ncbi:hypothetical protein OUZ56_016543 [Daphnia magna]|uniref:Uncharacterized protein n=1 Tax=Daphnia magna TaxID=35525 RepID=A0ABR0AQV4_9CRUS|nr:hypothetical protein OUZ56_016543 [Daphnia magna]
MLRDSDSEPEIENVQPGCSTQTETVPMNTAQPTFERIKNINPQLNKKGIPYIETFPNQGKQKDVLFWTSRRFGNNKLKTFGEDAEKFYQVVQEGELYTLQFAKVVPTANPTRKGPEGITGVLKNLMGGIAPLPKWPTFMGGECSGLTELKLVPNIIDIAGKQKISNKVAEILHRYRSLDSPDFETSSCAALELLPSLLPTRKLKDSCRFFFDCHEDSVNMAEAIRKPHRESPFILKHGSSFHIIADSKPYLYVSGESMEALLSLIATYYVFHQT